MDRKAPQGTQKNINMAQCHASCHEVQSRRQEKLEYDLTGNTSISLTYLACFSSPLSVRFLVNDLKCEQFLPSGRTPLSGEVVGN